ncbi:hypothetical protein ACOMHN_031269 [Nucella lapillus]
MAALGRTRLGLAGKVVLNKQSPLSSNCQSSARFLLSLHADDQNVLIHGFPAGNGRSSCSSAAPLLHLHRPHGPTPPPLLFVHAHTAGRHLTPHVAPSCRGLHSSSSNNKRDYYDVLGIPKSSDNKAIKKAYYQLAKKYHPDVNKNDPDAAKKFHEASEAYEVLGDEAKRRDYDTFGMSGARAGMGGPGGFQNTQGFGQGGKGSGKWCGHYREGRDLYAWTVDGFENFHGSIDPEELFRKIFGDAGLGGFANFTDFEESKFGFAPASEARYGYSCQKVTQDDTFVFQMVLNLTFQEAARGTNKEIHVNVKDTCPKCRGTKAELGTKPTKCTNCNGTGMETISTGPFVMRSTCRACGGSRVHIQSPCTECAGKGKIILRKKVIVPVPAGVEDGQTVRVTSGSQEIFILFKVAKSRVFRREGADIHSDVTVSLSQAVLGGTIRIPGIYGDILLSVPDGTHSHDRVRLVGKGISRVNSYGYGDHYVHFKIRVPVKLSTEQKAMIMAFAETEKDVVGTVKGVTQTETGVGGQKVSGERMSDDEGEGILARLKRKLFG